MLAYNKNSNGKFEIFEETIEWHGEIPEIVKSIFIGQVDSEFEAISLINMIEKYECEKALREEFECNMEKEPGWTCCP